MIAHENLRKPKIALALDRAMAERCGVTRPRIVDELARRARPSRSVSRVTVLDSATLSDDAAAAVAEVSQSANGSLRIKLHDKPAALEKLGRTFGMFKDRIEHIGKDGEPLKMRSDLEIGRRLAFVLELIARGEVKARLPDQGLVLPRSKESDLNVER